MKFEISHVTWDATEEEVKKLGLPTDDFEIEIDYDLEDPTEGPTEEEFDEIDTLLYQAISEEYAEPLDFGWGIIE